MKIALIGYGKMGREIESVAQSRGHEIVLRISGNNLQELSVLNLKKADLAIEFSTPRSVVPNIILGLDVGIPLVVGTTGWYQQVPEIESHCRNKNGAMLYASNFSIGMNILFSLNKKLASIMKNHPEYNVMISETHHRHKKDSPSGSAISLAEGILKSRNDLSGWSTDDSARAKHDLLFIESIRHEEVPGIHTVRYHSEMDNIELKHEALSRKGFAAGALFAAEWLYGKKGFFTLEDVLNMP